MPYINGNGSSASASQVSLTDHYSTAYAGGGDTPSLTFENGGSGEYAQIVLKDDLGPGDAVTPMRPLIISTGAKNDEAATEATGSVELLSGQNEGDGNSGAVFVSSGWCSGGGNTGALSLNTGDAYGAGNSGAITVQTGTSASGVRGNINLNGNIIDTSQAATGIRITNRATAPTVENGMGGILYYDTTTNKLVLRLANNTWVSIDTTAV